MKWVTEIYFCFFYLNRSSSIEYTCELTKAGLIHSKFPFQLGQSSHFSEIPMSKKIIHFPWGSNLQHVTSAVFTADCGSFHCTDCDIYDRLTDITRINFTPAEM